MAAGLAWLGVLFFLGLIGLAGLAGFAVWLAWLAWSSVLTNPKIGGFRMVSGSPVGARTKNAHHFFRVLLVYFLSYQLFGCFAG